MAGSSPAAASVKDLQAQLRRVTEERDRLLKDKQLSLASGDSGFFSSSYVLSEQIQSVQQELRTVKAQLKAAQDEVAIEREQATAARAAQSALEHSLNNARQQVASLTTDKEFYQASAARAAGEREATAEELTSLRSQLAEAELMLGRAEAHAISESRARKEAETTLAQRQQLLAQLRGELESKKSEAASTARQLAALRDTTRKLEQTSVSNAAKLEATSDELERSRGALQALRESEGRLRLQLQDAEAQVAQLQGTSRGQEEQLASLSSELEEVRASTSAHIADLEATRDTLQAQLTSSRESVTELSQELRQARQDLAAAEQRLTEARQAEHLQRTLPVSIPAPSEEGGTEPAGDTLPSPGPVDSAGSDDAEQLAILRTMVHDLKVKLAQATQEKVEALLAMAELKEAAQAGPAPPPPSTAATAASYAAGLASFMSARLPGFGYGSGRQHPGSADTSATGGGSARLAGSKAGGYATPPDQHRVSSQATPAERSRSPSLDLQPSVVGLRGPGSSSAAGDGPSTPQQSQAQAAALSQLVSEAREYLNTLQGAARCILGAGGDPAAKWAALSGLSQVHQRVNHTRARLGLDRPPSLLLDQGPPVLKKTASGAMGGPSPLSTQLTAEVLDLVDLGLAALEAFHRQEALASVMAH